MPLNELQRGVFVDYFTELDFTYKGFDPKVEVYRWQEGFSKENPYILVQFLPTSKKKFQSLSDVIGKAKGRFFQYGVCHIELVSIHVYCQESHQNESGTTIINGRELCDFISNKCLMSVLKDWEGILSQIGASFDRKDTIPVIRDLSGFDPETSTKIYNFDFDILIRTQLRWDKVPDDYDEDEDIAENAVLRIDPQGDENLRKIIRIRT